MIYAHSHPGSTALYGTARFAFQKGHAEKSAQQQTVQEKCYFCDVLHHNPMVVSAQAFFSPVHLTQHLFKAVAYDFDGTRRLHSSSRAPPSVI